MASNYICLSCLSGHRLKADLMEHMVNGDCKIFGNKIAGVSRRGKRLYIIEFPWLTEAPQPLSLEPSAQ